MSKSPISIHFDKALSSLASVGIMLVGKEDTSLDLILPLISKLEVIDSDNALAIGRIMQMSGAFNEVVRQQISSVNIGQRYAEIATLFDSIRNDTKDMVTWMQDGKLDWAERAKMSWMKLSRGTVNDRFEEVHRTFLSVIQDSTKQIEVESKILAGYQQFRFSIKEAEVAASTILTKATTALSAAKEKASTASASAQAENLDATVRTQLELARDIALHEAQESEKVFQIAQDLVNGLKVAYNTSDIVFARLQQNVDMKERIQQQSSAFFSTNETTFTALSAAFTSTQGLAESTNALEQMKAGANAAIEDLATLGNTQLERSVKAGYGATISAESVAKLADSIVSYQENLSQLVGQLRTDATENANEIARINENTKARFVAISQGEASV